MILSPVFPTRLHQDTAELVRDYFLKIPLVDTVLVVNSCARGQAVPESDLDFAILIKPETTMNEKINIESSWQIYLETQPLFFRFKQSGPFAHLHLDIIDGNYQPGNLGKGELVDYFEIEIGNQVCYSAPMHDAGPFFKELQLKWLPYYNEELRRQRLQMVKEAFTMIWIIYPCMQKGNFTSTHLIFFAWRFRNISKRFSLQTRFIPLLITSGFRNKL